MNEVLVGVWADAGSVTVGDADAKDANKSVSAAKIAARTQANFRTLFIDTTEVNTICAACLFNCRFKE
jgi:hypothetical protein